MKFKLDTGTGYMYAYDPSHPCSNKAGKVTEHVHVMSEAIGRPLIAGECVHHVDRDRTNNSLSNLILMTTREHARLHQAEDNGATHVDIECKSCGLVFSTSKKDRMFCSHGCAKKSRTRFVVPRDELEILVWGSPTTKIAEMFGVSDVAVAKRCKSLGITKPPRGYWRKLEAGTLMNPQPQTHTLSQKQNI